MSLNKAYSYSLVELLTVVAVIAILAAAAVSSYRSYFIRSSIAGLIPLADKVKAEVEDLHNQGTVFGTSISNTYVANSVPNKPFALYSITQVDYGCVNIQIDLAVLNLNPANTLILTQCPSVNNGAIVWTCGYDAASSSTYLSYLPANCQSSSSTIADTSF